ncbi:MULTISPECIES: AAA family ATPase [Halanaerobium]|uniref:Transcription elongation factor, GreA/GreB, C-term n=2 Tax=Halanaerobium TaxID=2330 RepID=A0A1G8SU33_9FIRM|nr:MULTISPECIES: AAA family ATPase [Halanaerobium]SDJ32090.1 Transcription elongation factor, GreA/GreB, C-term [Halanaerobium congolense]SET84553.1 Transcription elongation factor, GreA/GreB, C-term [Halanaerobium congolense]SIR56685.1 Transcription elongation factor, GreA/GreB, C-term [Halanaerobium kushneri]
MIKISKVLLDNLIGMTEIDSSSYMKFDGLCSKLDFSPEDLEADLNSLLKDNRIKMIDDKIYLAEHHKDESILADKINRRLDLEADKIDEILNQIKNQEESLGAFNSEQKKAIKSSFEEKLTVIDGREGTGKAEVIKATANIHQDVYPDQRVIITSPEGKDAENLTQGTELNFQPLSELLSYENGEFQQDEHHPIKGEGLIIVTDFHKCGLNMAKHLFTAAYSDFKIVLLGDKNKLSGYGTGNVFLELLNSSRINPIFLEKLRDSGTRKEITELLESISRKEILEIEDTGYLYFLNKDNKKEIFESLQQVVSISSIDSSPLDYQIIIPEVDTLDLYKLNLAMRPLLNSEETKEFCGFKKDDKVIINQDYKKKNIYKGNIGVVTEVGEDHLYIQLKNRQEMIFREKDLKTVSLGYVTTVKNNQGNKFPNVVAVFPTGDTEKFDNQLLYTSIAAATDTLFLIGSEDDMEEAAHKVRSFNNTLAEKIDERKRVVSLFDEFTVKDLDTDEELVYRLVPEDEHGIEKDNISIETDLGELVYQKTEGTTVSLRNTVDYEIVDIKPSHKLPKDLIAEYLAMFPLDAA